MKRHVAPHSGETCNHPHRFELPASVNRKAASGCHCPLSGMIQGQCKYICYDMQPLSVKRKHLMSLEKYLRIYLQICISAVLRITSSKHSHP